MKHNKPMTKITKQKKGEKKPACKSIKSFAQFKRSPSLLIRTFAPGSNNCVCDVGMCRYVWVCVDVMRFNPIQHIVCTSPIAIIMITIATEIDVYLRAEQVRLMQLPPSSSVSESENSSVKKYANGTNKNAITANEQNATVFCGVCGCGCECECVGVVWSLLLEKDYGML